MTSEELEKEALAAGGDILRAATLADPKLALDACRRARRVLDASAEYQLLGRCSWSEPDAADDASEPTGDYVMRAPCRKCGHRSGVLQRLSGQDTVRCGACGEFAYNAPRSEMGLPTEPPAPLEIASRYATACRVCRAPIAVGDRAIWTRTIPGVQCLGCGGAR